MINRAEFCHDINPAASPHTCREKGVQGLGDCRTYELAGLMSLIQPPPLSHDASQLHPAFHRTKLAIYSRIDICKSYNGPQTTIIRFNAQSSDSDGLVNSPLMAEVIIVPVSNRICLSSSIQSRCSSTRNNLATCTIDFVLICQRTC